MRNRRKRGGSPTLQGERNYQTARGIFGGYFETDDEVQDRVIRNALAPRFAKQKKSVDAIVGIAGSVNLFRFLGRVTITRQQGIDLFKRKEREMRKFPQSRQEAAALFVANLNARGSKISDTRPSALKRKVSKTRAAPEHGSFKRDIDMKTKIIGALKVDRNFNRMIGSLQAMIDTFRKLGVKGSGKFKTPKVNIGKSVTKSLKK